METLEIFDFLDKARVIEKDMQGMEYLAQGLRSCLRPAGRRYDKDKVDETREKDKIGDTMARIDELEKAIAEKGKEKARAIMAIDQAIHGAFGQDKGEASQAQANILYAYYVAGKTVAEIAAEQGYSERHCLRIKKQAVEKLKAYQENL